LDHIRQNYRNPVQHPEVFLTNDEVEVLLGITTSAIRLMVIEMQRIDLESTT
jgi:hypothetical protein